METAEVPTILEVLTEQDSDEARTYLEVLAVLKSFTEAGRPLRRSA